MLRYMAAMPFTYHQYLLIIPGYGSVIETAKTPHLFSVLQTLD